LYGGFRHNGGERWGERERSSWERAFDQAVVSPRSSAQCWDGILNDRMKMKSNRLFGDRQKERERKSGGF